MMGHKDKAATGRTLARTVTVALMGAAVLIATGDGFAQSYAGLLAWAHEHQVTGWRAASFPLLVDLFVMVGELGLFLLAIDGHKLTRRALSWVDLALPAATATAGWAVSLAFNIGRVKGGRWADQVTAGVPPVAAMVGLVILLRTLHRYVARAEETQTAPAPITWIRDDVADLFTAAPRGGREALADIADRLSVVGEHSDPMVVTARDRFSEVLAVGGVPSVRAIRRELRVGHPKASAIHAALTRDHLSGSTGEHPGAPVSGVVEGGA